MHTRNNARPSHHMSCCDRQQLAASPRIVHVLTERQLLTHVHGKVPTPYSRTVPRWREVLFIYTLIVAEHAERLFFVHIRGPDAVCRVSSHPPFYDQKYIPHCDWIYADVHHQDVQNSVTRRIRVISLCIFRWVTTWDVLDSRGQGRERDSAEPSSAHGRRLQHAKQHTHAGGYVSERRVPNVQHQEEEPICGTEEWKCVRKEENEGMRWTYLRKRTTVNRNHV